MVVGATPVGVSISVIICGILIQMFADIRGKWPDWLEIKVKLTEVTLTYL